MRRYAYWAVFGGCFGHTYGHNSVMQFIRPGLGASFGAEKPWWDAMKDPGYNQMKYLKWLILSFPFTERRADQSIIAGAHAATTTSWYITTAANPWTSTWAKSAAARRRCGG